MRKILCIVLLALQQFSFAQENSSEPVPKIALLFLTMDDVYHQEYWQDFLRGHEEYYSIYVHSKYSMPESSFFKPFEIKEKVRTTWQNTVRAQIVLLKEAFKDPANKKFIFLSESTIPFRAFEELYREVIPPPESIFTYHVNPHQDPTSRWPRIRRTLHPIPYRHQYKHPQWIILNRKHAQLAIEDRDIVTICQKYLRDSEHYFGSLLSIKGLLRDEVLNYNTTYEDWDMGKGEHPFTFITVAQIREWSLVIDMIVTEPHRYFFGRKFAKECDLSPIDPYLSYKQTAKK